MAKRIEDYALIGDCESAALVGRDGSIDWLCWPRFNSGSVFSSLLGGPENGCWRLGAESKDAAVTRRYRGNSLILETHIETATGAATVTDFMPLRDGGSSHVVRLVQGQGGHVEMTTEFVLRFDYGLIVPWITQIDGCGLEGVAGPDKAVLRTDVPLVADGYRHRGTFTVAAGETVSFVLSYGRSFRPNPAPIDAKAALDETRKLMGPLAEGFQPGRDRLFRCRAPVSDHVEGADLPVNGGHCRGSNHFTP